MIKNRLNTPIKTSVILTLFQSLIPGIIVWVLFGAQTHAIMQLTVEYRIITSVSLVLWALITTFLSFRLGLSNYDQFSFSIPITITVVVLFNVTYLNLSFVWYTVICFVSIIVSIIVVNYCVMYIANRHNWKG
ncbi:hypothetical protein ASO20_00820 [Mycoplasma sp. (ex Biomphalaria glabrata)]|uniref:hypothetical protein n=1 Tax=Mycoplasma sp. (ex Biomphalaria glabrata) TaxID=1749074 RepID=UPI00073A6267|nr:hypothetical protein [Mycoplasma sp. (ex Biomphalaria glabrata)]ALV23218.1 hypothetical protein ASO20_00820 [Mycoplasma sp. (ex Biomphalaria glabrata)]